MGTAAAGTTLAAGGTLAAAGSAFAAGTTAGLVGSAVGGGLTAGALGSTAATLGGVAGGALGGAGLGAGVGAAGSAITGGDVGEGAAMGAATGALTGGVAGGFAAPVVTPAVGATGGAAAVPATIAPGAGLGAVGTAGVAGASRTGVGLASGKEDIEQAGIAGLTAAGTSAIGSGIGKLAANPNLSQGVSGPLSEAQGKMLTPDLGEVGMTPAQVGKLGVELPGGDTVYSGAVDGVDQGIDYSGYWDNLAKTNPEMMGIGENIAKHDFTAGAPDIPAAPIDTIPTTNLPAVTDPGLPDPSMLDQAGTGLQNAWRDFTYDPSVEGQEMLGNTPTTSVSEGLGNLADQFSTTDKAIDSAKFLAPQTTLTAGGLYAQKQLGIEDAEAAAEEKRKREYSENIWNNYVSQGRMPHESSSLYKYGFANGGIVGLTNGLGDGTSDSIPAVVDGGHPARLSSNEFVIPADVVSHIGNGSTEAGAQSLYDMMDRLRVARTNSPQQPNDINPRKYLPA